MFEALGNPVTVATAVIGALTGSASFVWNVWKHLDERKRERPIADLTLHRNAPDELVLRLRIRSRQSAAIVIQRVEIDPTQGVSMVLWRCRAPNQLIAAPERSGEAPPWTLDFRLEKDEQAEIIALAKGVNDQLKSLNLIWLDAGPSQKRHIIRLPIRADLAAEQFVNIEDLYL